MHHARRRALSAVSDAWASAVAKAGVHTTPAGSAQLPARLLHSWARALSKKSSLSAPAALGQSFASAPGAGPARLPGGHARTARRSVRVTQLSLPRTCLGGCRQRSSPAAGAALPYQAAASMGQHDEEEPQQDSFTDSRRWLGAGTGGRVWGSPRLAAAALLAAAPTEAAAADGFGPVVAAMQLIDGLHSATGIPWWATLAATALGEACKMGRWRSMENCKCIV